jgi:sec-independent protein translocase protein TatA
MPNIGPLGIAILVIIGLLLFGAKRVPEMARSLGAGMREFAVSLTGKDREESLGLPPADEPAVTGKTPNQKAL